MIYDIIGDIHGQAEKLEILLDRLGYSLRNGLYTRTGHTPVFVGDLIDRGPQQRGVLEIVRPLVTEGLAHVVMGNHEYNAICYHTKRPGADNGEWLREHTEDKAKQHKAFLLEYPLGQAATREIIEWFKGLPVYIDFGHFRVIHACWDETAINRAHELGLLKKEGIENSLNQQQLATSATKGTEQFDIMERLLKGPELHGTPPFRDTDGNERHEVRARWWGDISPDATYRDLAFYYDREKVTLPEKKVKDYALLPRYEDDLPPVFFGHYGLNGKIQAQQSNVICLDYSAGKDGPLVAYRFDTAGPSRIAKENFHTSF